MPTEPLHIRRVLPGEAAALRAIFASSVRGIASRHYSAEQIEAWCPAICDEESLAAWSRRIEANQPWVAVVDGVAAAFADLQPSGYIDHFFVAHDVAGKGIGKALMDHLHGLAHASGIARLQANVSLTAQPFFQRAGFVIDQVQTVMVRGVELQNAVMSKKLHRAR